MQTFPLRTHFERVIIKVEPVQSESNILIMGDDVEKKSTIGTILAIGPMVERDSTIRPGDRVLFRKFSGETFTWEGEEYLLAMASDVLITFPKPKEHGSTLRSI